MKRNRRLLRLTSVLLAPIVLTGCIDEISQIFSIILLSESDDPDERETGEVLAEVRVSREARQQVDTWLETGDEQFLDNALELQPDDTELYGYKLALATLHGDPDDITASKEALALAEARRLASLREPGDPPTTATMVRRNVLGELLVAQTRMLGGSLNTPWDPPGDDEPLQQQQLFSDYCNTKAEIARDFAEDLSYIRTPDCPVF